MKILDKLLKNCTINFHQQKIMLIYIGRGVYRQQVDVIETNIGSSVRVRNYEGHDLHINGER